MQFRLLGRLEVEDGGAELAPARPKPRALLAILLLRAGEVVATDELIELLWGGEPPPTARTALHGYISALRKLLGSRLETVAPGYRLQLHPDDDVDVHRVESLAAGARTAAPLQQSERLAAALALFRGEPLADLRLGGADLAGPVARLEDLQLDILEQKATADLTLGRHEELIPELQQMLGEHPLRERLREQLMLALYRASRQADALQVAQQGRRALADELGIDPSPSLQRLERQILEQDPGLEAPGPAIAIEPPAPGSILTFLSADLAPLHRHGQSRRGAHVEGSQSLRAVVPRHHGVLIAEDPLTAAFRRSSDAADAALDMQAATRHLDARPRIGLDSAAASGRGEWRREPGARSAGHLRRAAHPGQTLVSGATRRLLEDTARHDLGIVDLGEHLLTDLAPARHVYQLDDPRRPSRYPPIPSLETRPVSLPPQPTSLVGRELETDAIAELVASGAERIVTLTGPGGTGKTRLALHAAAELVDRFPDGIHLVELAPLADPSLVGPTVSRALDTGRTSAAAVRGRPVELEDLELLLVLDNFEHLLAAAPAIGRLARESPLVRFLITSRAPLQIPGERVYEIGPLATPPDIGDPARLMAFDSVLLFTDRARALRPEFAVNAANARAVAELCVALDGLPLAIELAASRVAVLPPAAFTERLDRRLELLDAGLRAASPRHESLRATIAWSHDLLEERERRLFERLAVFAGGADLEAVEAVCGDGIDVVRALASLVDLSLVRAAGDVQRPRFSMLDTIRGFAADLLLKGASAREVRARHASHFLSLAERAEPHLRGDPGGWLDRLEVDLDNLRAALGHLAAEGDAEAQQALAGALWRFWYLRGHLSEGRSRLEAALERDPRPTPARGKALIGAAVMAMNLGDTDAAMRRAQEGLSLHRSLGDRWGAAYCGFMLGNATDAAGDPPRAQELFADSIRVFRELADEHSALLAVRSLANSLEDSGDRVRAATLLADSLRLARATHNPRLEASILGTLGAYAYDEGRLSDSLWMLRESLRIHAEQGDHLDSAVALARAARVLAMTGNSGVALRLLASLSTVRQEIGGRRALVAGITDETVARVRRQLDAVALDAEWRFGEALSIADALALALEALPSPSAAGAPGVAPRPA